MKIPRIKTRTLLGFNPVTRRVPSKKGYSHLRTKIESKTQE